MRPDHHEPFASPPRGLTRRTLTHRTPTHRTPARLAALLATIITAGCGGSSRPNIILITLESIRPPHLSTYGYERTTSPALDELANEAIVFDNAYAVTSWTLTSHASLFTGLYPSAHQVQKPRDSLSDAHVTLAEVLQSTGYQTAAIVSGPFLRAPYNLHQGFELYDDTPASPTNEEAHGDVTNPRLEELVTRFLRETRRADTPFFLFLYVWDPHYDYVPPAPYAEAFVPPGAEPVDVRNYLNAAAVHPDMPPAELAYVISQYDGEISCTDAMLGRLWDELRDLGIWDDTAIIVTSDHGEEFFEHGNKGHKNGLYVEAVHVPLIVKPGGWGTPAATSARDDRLVSLVDLFPTVLEIAHVEMEHVTSGRSVLGPEPESTRTIFFELLTTQYLTHVETQETHLQTDRWLGARDDRFKLIGRPSQSLWELYDVRAEPGEQTPLGDAHLADAERLVAALEAHVRESQELARRLGPSPEIELTDEEQKRLRSLGYLGGGSR